MIKVLIADDEIWICELIKKSVPWEKLDMKVAGTAKDGYQTYQMITSLNPDIVIVDIKMPIIDGISLIERVRLAALNTHFIIISGYDYFKYAQTALKLGVEGYLLKPIDENELYDALKKIKFSIDSKMQTCNKLESLRCEALSNLAQLQESFILSLLTHTADSDMTITEINEKYSMAFEVGIFDVVIYKFESDNINIKSSDFDYYASIISDAIKVSCFSFFSIIQNDSLVCILNYPTVNKEHVDKGVKDALTRILTAKYKLPIHVTVGIGSKETNIYSLYRSYNSALDSLKCRIFIGTDRVLDISKLYFYGTYTFELITVEKEREFIALVEAFKSDEICSWIRNTVEQFADNNSNPCILFKLLYQIVELFYKSMGRMGYSVEKNFMPKEQIYFEIDNCKSLNQMIVHVSDFICDILEKYCDEMNINNPGVIAIAKMYISKNYSKNIKLTDIADHVFLNPTYFSVLFKKNTGTNFTDYLANYRMEVAKNLLMDIRYRIYNVAEMVGYKDVKYFSKLFKKYIGLNPGHYRKVHLKSKNGI